MEISTDSNAKQGRRLHLHIPNSHPRGTSPRSSPRSSPRLESFLPVTDLVSIDAEHQVASASHTMLADSLQRPQAEQSSVSKAFTYFRADTTSGESSRDFLARERTYFSWLRLSALLAIASVALFLRLRLPSIDEATVNSVSTPRGRLQPPQDVANLFAAAHARKAMRKQFGHQDQNGIIRSLPPRKDDIQYIISNSTSDDSSLIRNPAFSKVLGSLFFVLAIVALLCGHVDYMRCERALEEADKLVTMGDQLSGMQGQGERMRLHNASSAKKAHSSHLVHAVEIIIALSVFFTALIILVTVTQGNIQPPSPGR